MGRTQMVRAGPYMKQAGGLTARCVMVGSSFFTVAERGARARHRRYGCRRLPPCAHVIKRAAPVKTHGAGDAENSWQILSWAHLVRCDFQWVAKS